MNSADSSRIESFLLRLVKNDERNAVLLDRKMALKEERKKRSLSHPSEEEIGNSKQGVELLLRYDTSYLSHKRDTESPNGVLGMEAQSFCRRPCKDFLLSGYLCMYHRCRDIVLVFDH